MQASAPKMSTSIRLAAWSQQAMEQRRALGFAPGHKPWTGSQEHCYTGMRVTPRIQECMDLAFMATFGPSKTSSDLTSADKLVLANFFLDCSQNPLRRAWTNRAGITRCLTTSTSLYAFERDSLVLPVELMWFQGHRRDLTVPPELGQRGLRELAGEGICLPVLATVFAGLIMSGGL